MKTVDIDFGTELIPVKLPEATEVLAMTAPVSVADPFAAVQDALRNSIASPGLKEIIRRKLQHNPNARAVVVVSDNTRPVPYRGEAGILWPVIQELLDQGFTAERILILVATGTHRALAAAELRTMLDPRVFELEIPVENHNCLDRENLVYLGETSRASRVYLNRHYMEADLKILTGLVESHFMAGVSGGRKSVCPGLIGQASTYVFHGAPMLASPGACNLQLENNPCHEEALEIARKAGVDYILNVTLDPYFKLTGVFGGDLEKAHQAAVNHLKSYSGIPVGPEYDIGITHAGFVGVNHYQAAKAGVAVIPALKAGGSLVLVANNTDPEPVGSPNYQTVLHLLKLMGPEKFNKLLLSPDWSFVPDQWQVQMWAKLFAKIAPDDLIYYSPQLSRREYQRIPGRDGNELLPAGQRYRGSLADAAEVIGNAVQQRIAHLEARGQKEIRLAFWSDGPYAVPVKEN